MSFSIRGRFREQVRFLRRQFLQDGELPFNDVLSESAVVTQANDADGHFALQDARAGTEGDLDAHSGLQSHPNHYGSSGDQARHRAKNNQL